MKKITDKPIIVTGGAGFIGGYVIDELARKGYETLVLDNLSKKESKVPKNSRFVNVDLCDKKKVVSLFRKSEYCINLASKIGGIGYFNKVPADILSENNKIFSSTFEASAACRHKRMVYISSSMVYESSDIQPLKEENLMSILPPKTGYGFSKLSGEYYCKTFLAQYGLNYTIIRPFNAYGIYESPGDYVGYSHVIPDLVKKILSGSYPVEILGDGEQTRCFTHVKDIAKGIVMALESESAVNEDFNLGSSEEIKIIDLAKKIWVLLGQEKEFRYKALDPFLNDIKRRVPDSSKAQKILGWKPAVGFERGLKETVDWLRTDKNWKN